MFNARMNRRFGAKYQRMVHCLYRLVVSLQLGVRRLRISEPSRTSHALMSLAARTEHFLR